MPEVRIFFKEDMTTIEDLQAALLIQLNILGATREMVVDAYFSDLAFDPEGDPPVYRQCLVLVTNEVAGEGVLDYRLFVTTRHEIAAGVDSFELLMQEVIAEWELIEPISFEPRIIRFSDIAFDVDVVDTNKWDNVFVMIGYPLNAAIGHGAECVKLPVACLFTQLMPGTNPGDIDFTIEIDPNDARAMLVECGTIELPFSFMIHIWDWGAVAAAGAFPTAPMRISRAFAMVPPGAPTAVTLTTADDGLVAGNYYILAVTSMSGQPVAATIWGSYFGPRQDSSLIQATAAI